MPQFQEYSVTRLTKQQCLSVADELNIHQAETEAFGVVTANQQWAANVGVHYGIEFCNNLHGKRQHFHRVGRTVIAPITVHQGGNLQYVENELGVRGDVQAWWPMLPEEKYQAHTELIHGTEPLADEHVQELAGMAGMLAIQYMRLTAAQK